MVGGAFGSPAETTPLTIIATKTVLAWWQSDRNVTHSGGVASALNSNTGAAHYTAAGAAQPTYTAADATFNNRPTLTGDGVAHLMSTTLARPSPSVENTWYYLIVKQVSWSVSGRVIMGYGATSMCVRQIGSTPLVDHANTTSSSANTTGATIGSWARIHCEFANGADRLKVGATAEASGVNVGDVDPPDTLMLFGTGSGGNFSNIAFYAGIVCNGRPTDPEIAALDAMYNSASHGNGVVLV